MQRIALYLLVASAPGCCFDFSWEMPDHVMRRLVEDMESMRMEEANFEALERLLALAPEVRAVREAQLAEALAAFDAARSEENAIWVGRRLAYLGFYEAAVWWFQFRTLEFPDSYRLRRHLGHRQLTLRNPREAVRELEEARGLAAGHDDELEPDGMPNAAGIPTSTTHGNIDYHLALARYLLREYEPAAEAWRRCVDEWATNDDARVAAAHWLCTSLRRLGRHQEARSVALALPAAPEVIENLAYRDLIDLHAGRRTAEALLAETADPVQNATRAYGVARWLMDREDATETEIARGTALLQELQARGDWASFGRIAAEADLGLVDAAHRTTLSARWPYE